jgi:hypothetical protein
VEQLALTRGAEIGEATELAAWLSWAREQADKLDPVRDALERLTGERPD